VGAIITFAKSAKYRPSPLFDAAHACDSNTRGEIDADGDVDRELVTDGALDTDIDAD
jgi:hypothetical protein